MGERGDWVDGVICQFRKYVVDIDNVWSEIGYPTRKRADLNCSLLDNSTKILRDVLASAESERNEIRRKVDQMKAEIATIENELRIPHRHMPPRETLLGTLSDLTDYHADLDKKICEMTADFKKLKVYEENLCTCLNISALEGFPLIPSHDDKLRLQHHVNELEDIKRDRESRLMKMKDRISSCIDYLKSDCIITLPEPFRSLVDLGSEPKNLSEAFITRLDEFQDSYMDLFHKFKSEEEDLLESVESLRKRLDLAPFILTREQSICPSIRIKHLSDELSRLKELRLINLRRLMEACVLELEGVWTECFVNTEYRQSFRDSTSLECTEANLSRLENEVHKWKHFKSSHQDFYDALTVWLDTLNQIKTIELRRQDPTVLKNRGGILLKLDKEDRKLRTRDLPNQTVHLESIIGRESGGEDAELFALVCFEGQSLVGQKENTLASIIGRSLEPSGAIIGSAQKQQTSKDGFIYAVNKRPAVSRKASPPSSASTRSQPDATEAKKPRLNYDHAGTNKR